MSRGRDTNTLRIEKDVLAEILRNCSDPSTLGLIFGLTKDLAFRRISVEEFDAYCGEQPCIFWQPDDPNQRHVDVRVTRETERVMIHVCRIVWTVCHVTAEQGEPLRGHEELLHSCGHNGAVSTAFGACLNPAHMVKGTPESRLALKKIRFLKKQIGLQEVAVQ